MINKIYCPNCDTSRAFDSVEKPETFDVRGEAISMISKVNVCSHCKNEISNEALDDKTLDSVYAEYRHRHRLLTPDQIKATRTLYGLSQRALCKLLEWGEATIARYEAGALQDAVHNEVLEFIQNPENMRTLFEKNKHLLTNDEAQKINDKVQSLSLENDSSKLFDTLEDFLNKQKSIDEYSGYKKFDLNKIKSAILYITSSAKEFKTKLNKLLWYSDFLYFKMHSVSITGTTYLHYQYGPVPTDYDTLLHLMVLEGKIRKDVIVYDESKGIYGEEISALTAYDKSVFDKSEMQAIDYVLSYFKKFNSRKIKDYSHEEQPYKQTALKEKISYTMAEKLSLSLPD